MPEEIREDFSRGAAYVGGRYVPLDQATIPITDWGYRRSDVTYDVVSVWRGMFFRLDDHVDRFRRSMNALRLSPPETDEDIKAIVHRCVRLSGLRDAYVAIDCLRGSPRAGKLSSRLLSQLSSRVRSTLDYPNSAGGAGTRRTPNHRKDTSDSGRLS